MTYKTSFAMALWHRLRRRAGSTIPLFTRNSQEKLLSQINNIINQIGREGEEDEGIIFGGVPCDFMVCRYMLVVLLLCLYLSLAGAINARQAL